MHGAAHHAQSAVVDPRAPAPRSRFFAASVAWPALLTSLGGCETCRPAHHPVPPRTEIRAPAREPRWLKGQLHLHSERSGDSATSPDQVVRWYEGHGYDFIVFTDHNYVSVVPGRSQGEGVLVVPGVELTQNQRHCDPEPEPGLHCLLHVNALFVAPRFAGPLSTPETGPRRVEIFGAAIAQARRLGGIAQVNHPNFHYAADAGLLGQLVDRGANLLEIANEAIDSNNEGDRTHPSTEELWDALLSNGKRVWGTATDDAHHYDDADRVRASGETAHVGDRGLGARVCDSRRGVHPRGSSRGSVLRQQRRRVDPGRAKRRCARSRGRSPGTSPRDSVHRPTGSLAPDDPRPFGTVPGLARLRACGRGRPAQPSSLDAAVICRASDRNGNAARAPTRRGAAGPLGSGGSFPFLQLCATTCPRNPATSPRDPPPNRDPPATVQERGLRASRLTPCTPTSAASLAFADVRS